MEFDPENAVNKLCAEGMQLEGEGKSEEAATLFYQAWKQAGNPVEKLTAAHYLARHQNSIADKLKWDITALQFAGKVPFEAIGAVYPSLYLNVAKGFEDLNDFTQADNHYRQALNYVSFLPNDGYGNMIKGGINNGIARLKKLRSKQNS